MNINCYNKATQKMVKKQFRDNKGRFSKRNILLNLLGIVVVFLLFVIGFNWNKTEVVPVVVDRISISDTAVEIINKEKTAILDDLLLCESGGNKDAISWKDRGVGKNTASFGAYQFKIGTIQKFNSSLTDFQAIALASDLDQSRRLAEHIIFNTEGGIYNWKNCMNKNNLLERVGFVKKLESKLNDK